MVKIFQAIKQVFKRAVGITPPPVKLQQNIVPFGLGRSVAVKGVQTGIGLLGKAKNVVARQFTNPFAGVSVKQGVINVVKKVGGYATTGALFGVAYTGSKALVTGSKVSVPMVLKSAGHGALAGTNPFGALAGTGAGFTSIIAQNLPKSQAKFDLTPTWQPQIKTDLQVPQIPDYTDALKSLQGNSIAPINVMMPPQPQAPSVGFSPSISVGGGGSEILPLMLLLAGGAGLAGYSLGRRRKRKKKKYKKRRR